MISSNNSRKQIQIERKCEYLTVEQAADLLSLKISRVRNMVFKSQVPYLKIGASIRFNKAQLVSWYESKTRGGSNVATK